MSSPASRRIRQLNDDFRKSSPSRDWMFTSGVADQGLAFVLRCAGEVQKFEAFGSDNDPHGEHDFGSFMLNDQKLFWKIDYYGPSLDCGSEDPSDSAKTRRVMTIMLASEY